MFDISHQSLNAQNDVVVVTPAVVQVEGSIGRLAESELEIFQNFCMLFAVHCDKKYLCGVSRKSGVGRRCGTVRVEKVWRDSLTECSSVDRVTRES